MAHVYSILYYEVPLDRYLKEPPGADIHGWAIRNGRRTMVRGQAEQVAYPYYRLAPPSDKVYIVMSVRAATAGDATGSLMAVYIDTPDGIAVLAVEKSRMGLSTLDVATVMEPGADVVFATSSFEVDTAPIYCCTFNPPIPILPQESLVANILAQQE